MNYTEKIVEASKEQIIREIENYKIKLENQILKSDDRKEFKVIITNEEEDTTRTLYTTNTEIVEIVFSAIVDNFMELFEEVVSLAFEEMYDEIYGEYYRDFIEIFYKNENGEWVRN